ncbi:helix-turn-helix domain-containing protein [Streptomyces mirabilis]
MTQRVDAWPPRQTRSAGQIAGESKIDPLTYGRSDWQAHVIGAELAVPKQMTTPPPAGGPRYVQGGGMTREGLQSRQQLRMEAARRFARGENSPAIAKELRVHVRSVQQWRRTWQNGGAAALRSKGYGSLSRLTDAEFAVLEAALAEGPMAHGWPDQNWTLSRIAAVLERKVQVVYSLQGVRKLLMRHGYSRRLAAREAVGQHHEAITGWVKDTWPPAHASSTPPCPAVARPPR